MINKWKCNECNGIHPCWMIIEFAELNPNRDDHPIDKKLLKRCIMDRKAKAKFNRVLVGRPRKVSHVPE
jgi:hypothetical protein